MPTLTVDGEEITVTKGTTVIQAAEKLGSYVPRYCYHPGLSVAGSCRMCLVEIENLPRLAISCYTRAQDGMRVSTDSEKARRGRRAMLEFLLTNHPLDCPVCDQSGECDLQNYYMEIGQYESRFLENKIKRKKAFPIGPHVMLDQERCILCTRCTRFCEEVSGSRELGVFNRSNRSVIDLYPGKMLSNPYSGNVIDICPVGALTEREFRFKCRVWYLRSQSSICSGCSRGCNISIHYNPGRSHKADGHRVQRLKPRYNPFVNQWWMCDEGRFGYHFMNQNRLEYPHLRQAGELVPTEWNLVTQEVITALKTALDKFGPEGIGVVASPRLCNEELYLIRELFGRRLGLKQMGCFNPWEKEGFQDDFLIRADKNPNSRGAREMGLDGGVREILEKGARGEIKVLYVFDHDFKEEEACRLLRQTEYLIYQGSNWTSTAQLAGAVLPSATHAEQEGTFTNFEGRIQRFQQAFPPPGEAQTGLEILCRLARGLEQPLEYAGSEEVFREWRGKPYRELDEYGEVGSRGEGAG